MATITLTHDQLHLTLTRPERVAALHGDVHVPLGAVQDVRLAPDALAATRGLRAPGLSLPRRTKLGTWRSRGRKRFAVARRGVPAVHVFLSGAAFDELIVSLPGAPGVVEGLRAQVGLAPTDPRAARELQVAVPGPAGRLAGALTLPAGAGPHAAALILPGSGPVDRDADLPRLALGVGRDLARALADRGVASLRYDKRGVGGSDGSFPAAGLYDNVDDARAALAWLRARPEVGETFLVGHSEGALLAMALGDEQPAGVVLLAGAAKTGEATLAWQTRRIAAGLPRPVRLGLRAVRIDLAAKQAKNVAKLRATTTDVAWIGARKVNARWHRELLDFDPVPWLADLRAPVLAITGAKDIQVDPADLERIAALTRADTVCVPDLTHGLRRDAGPPSISAYKRLVREPIDPEVLRLVGDWVVAHEVAHAQRG
jgi:alpha/beta superfamily hydrolase